MSQEVTISSVTANTPVEIYYCDSMSASCVYVATVSTFPYTFDVPAPYDEQDFVVKIIDCQSCEIGHTIEISPTPTNTITPTITPTSTVTPTVSLTPTLTPTVTPSLTPTNTITPTITSTPTETPVISSHRIGNSVSAISANTCNSIITIQEYYTYISEANLTPVVGATVYTTNVSGVLYNPFNGGNQYILMQWGSDYYITQINSFGLIVNFQICGNLITSTPTPTSTSTSTPTITPTNSVTPTTTPTNSVTPTITPTVTVTSTITSTPGVSSSPTPTTTSTPTVTITNSSTPTNTPSSTGVIGSLFEMFLFELGSDVIMSGSGRFDTTALSFGFTGNFQGLLRASLANFISGPSSLTASDNYTGVSTYPSNFGSGGQFLATSGVGDIAGILYLGPGDYRLLVPTGYVSNSALTTQTTYSGKTLTSLGATAGTYIYSWGSGANSGTLILKVGV